MRKILLIICIGLGICLFSACDSLAMRYIWAGSEPLQSPPPEKQEPAIMERTPPQEDSL